MNKNVLIISHLAINSTNNVGKTLYQLFKGFDKEYLAQLFFNPTLPNVDLCKYWYRITDDEVIKSYYGSKAGSEYFFDGNQIEDVPSNLYKKSVGKSTSRLLIRDVIWKLARIDWNGLYSWLDKVHPDVLFLAPGYSVFVYRIAVKISKRLNIPIVFFSMDDYYNEKKNTGYIFEFIRRTWLRNHIRSTIKRTNKLLAVCEEMAEDYAKCFSISTDVVYTPYEDVPTVHCKMNQRKNIRFTFAGSLGLNRWKTLMELSEYMKKNDYPGEIYVYSSPAYSEEIEKMSACSNIFYKGFISADELSLEIQNTDFILHVESFDKDKLQRTRYSISTKIPECLASGIPFLVIGPKEQASVKYVQKNKAGLVCTNKEEIACVLDKIFKKDIDYDMYIANAKKLLEKNHSYESIQLKLYDAFNA